MTFTITIPFELTNEFLKFVKDAETNQYNICIESDYTSIIYPYIGNFTYVYENEKYTISYTEVGTPMSVVGEVVCYTKIQIHGDDLKKLQQFVTAALTKTSLEKDSNTHIQLFMSSSHGFFCNSGNIIAQTMDRIFIPQKIKNDIRNSINAFINSKERYYKYGRSYKTSFMFTGVPGSGKTSLVKAIALEYKRPLYTLNFTKEMTDQKFLDLMSELKKDSILLIEDLDAFFVDRQPQDINVSFSALLNFMDGVNGKGEGVITFVTANNPERFDSALIRPGRIDKIIKFESPKRQEIECAFNDMTDGKNFTDFYDHIKHVNINMSGIIDYLFRHPDDYLDNIEQLLNHTKCLNDITYDKLDKMYV
jgi:hypothetical protein